MPLKAIEADEPCLQRCLVVRTGAASLLWLYGSSCSLRLASSLLLMSVLLCGAVQTQAVPRFYLTLHYRTWDIWRNPNLDLGFARANGLQGDPLEYKTEIAGASKISAG